MAQIDMSNAVLTPMYSGTNGTSIPLLFGFVSLMADYYILDSSDQRIGTVTYTTSTEEYSFENIYNGTFTASGTEFWLAYIYNNSITYRFWRISNISFQSGDTFEMNIKYNLTVN